MRTVLNQWLWSGIVTGALLGCSVTAVGAAHSARGMGVHHLRTNSGSPAFVFGGQTSMRPLLYRVTILVNGTIVGHNAPFSLKKNVGFDAHVLLRFAERDGYFSLPGEIASISAPADVGSTFISVITTSGKKTVIRAALGRSAPFDRLYQTLLDAVRVGPGCVAPNNCPPKMPGNT